MRTHKMKLNASLSLLFLSHLLAFSTVVTADNITQAFAKYSNFSTMSDLLTKTKLTIPISKFRTITVLAVSNDAISPITNRSDIELKNILMTHIILDYYDELKLNGMKEKSIMLTTLYQTTGLGEEMNGFLNCTKSKGRVYFGSEVNGSPLDAEYVRTVYQNPYNMSILEISMPIVAPGLSLAIFPPPPPPAPPIAPAPSPSTMAPSPSPMSAATVSAPSPGPAGEDNASDTTVPKPKPATETTPQVDSSAPAVNADDQKVESADKAGPSSSACKAGLSFEVVLLLAIFSGFARL